VNGLCAGQPVRAQLTWDLLRRSIQNPATNRRHQLGKLIKRKHGARQWNTMKVAFDFANRCLWPRYDDCLFCNYRNGEVNFFGVQMVGGELNCSLS
jgi:hypothetical protein